jgi:SAM-dependent methyltransferase
MVLMKRHLLDRLTLVCPACAWDGGAEASLDLTVHQETDGDVLSGHLACPTCPRRYPILEGVAVLDPEPLRSTYDRPDFLQAYLWTHYGDLSPKPLDPDGPERGDYFERLAARPSTGLALDLGCNVGRATFDLARSADFVLGVERSYEAVKRAREICRSRRVAFHLKDEGDRGRYVDLDASEVVRDNVEFICGDASALPLGPEIADSVAAANLIDRLANPVLFLARADKILKSGGRLTLTAPFTWRAQATVRERWLCDAKRSGRDAILEWFEEHDYEVTEDAELSLTIRNDRRFFELIRPVLLEGVKG